MTDRQLLELAAKAAGMNGGYAKHFGVVGIIARNHTGIWNPLEDDGDALRLAVKLELRISTHCNQKQACAYGIYGECDPQVEDWGNDPYAATRRAIVRAAAEIGKGMK